MTDVRWYRQDKAEVARRLAAGEQPDLAATSAIGPLDDLIALHEELGAFAAIVGVETDRERAGIADALLLRTAATLPFVGNLGLRGQATLLLREPVLLLRLGWAPVQIREGDNGRYRHPNGRQAESLPCHADTLRDALARIGEAAWLRAQQRGVQALFARGLIRGKVYAIDGTGLDAEKRVVALVCVSGQRPFVVAWRYLEGSASEKGKEAVVSRALIEQALAAGGETCIGLLLADALYADGPLLAWLKYAKGIDALVRLPPDRVLYGDLQGLVRAGLVTWTEHTYLRTIQGHKQRRTVALAAGGDFTSWDSFREAATAYGALAATLWACLIREVSPQPQPMDEAGALVSTCVWDDPTRAFQAFRPRRVIEDATFRELKEGWGLERHPWSESGTIVRARVTLTLLAFNTAQVYRTTAGEHLADKGIRRLRLLHRPALGVAPAVIYLHDMYGVFALEELLTILGAPPKESLLPHPRPPSSRTTIPP
jgi:hypothetical protein